MAKKGDFSEDYELRQQQEDVVSEENRMKAIIDRLQWKVILVSCLALTVCLLISALLGLVYLTEEFHEGPDSVKREFVGLGLTDKKVNHSEADEVCKTQFTNRSKLAFIGDSDMYRFAKVILNLYEKNEDFWLDANYDDKEKVWKHGKEKLSFTNWAPKQPGNGSEHCLVMKKDGWHDYYCNKTKHFALCQIKQ